MKNLRNLRTTSINGNLPYQIIMNKKNLKQEKLKCVYYLRCKAVHVIIYEANHRYAFRSYLYNYFYSYIQFFQSKRITKKIVKVIEYEIYSKPFRIYKGTEKVVLAKFVEAISQRHSFQLKLYSILRKPFLLVEAIFSSRGHFFQWKPFFQRKPLLLMEAVPFSQN